MLGPHVHAGADARLGATALALSARGLLRAERVLARAAARAAAVQGVVRGNLARKEQAVRKESATRLQAHARRRAAAKARAHVAADVRGRTSAATTVQRHIKGRQERGAAARRRSSVLTMQRAWRLAYRRVVVATTALQAAARGWQARQDSREERSAVTLQRAMRGRSSRVLAPPPGSTALGRRRGARLISPPGASQGPRLLLWSAASVAWKRGRGFERSPQAAQTCVAVLPLPTARCAS